MTGRWDFASGCRHANWMGAHGHVVEADGSLRLNRFGRPVIRTFLFPAEQATLIDTWNTIGLRGTASDSLQRRGSCSCPKPSAPRARSPSCAASGAPSTPSRCRASMPSARPASRSGIARAMLDEFIALAMQKDAAGPVAAGRQCGRAGRRRSRGSATRRGAGLSARHAGLDLRAAPTTSSRSTFPTARGCGLPAPTPSTARSRWPTHLQGRRRRRDLPWQPVRAPLPRHPHALAADPVAQRPLRGRRPGPPRHAARGVLLDRVVLRGPRSRRPMRPMPPSSGQSGNYSLVPRLNLGPEAGIAPNIRGRRRCLEQSLSKPRQC